MNWKKNSKRSEVSFIVITSPLRRILTSLSALMVVWRCRITHLHQQHVRWGRLSKSVESYVFVQQQTLGRYVVCNLDIWISVNADAVRRYQRTGQLDIIVEAQLLPCPKNQETRLEKPKQRIILWKARNPGIVGKQVFFPKKLEQRFEKHEQNKYSVLKVKRNVLKVWSDDGQTALEDAKIVLSLLMADIQERPLSNSHTTTRCGEKLYLKEMTIPVSFANSVVANYKLTTLNRNRYFQS